MFLRVYTLILQDTDLRIGTLLQDNFELCRRDVDTWSWCRVLIIFTTYGWGPFSMADRIDYATNMKKYEQPHTNKDGHISIQERGRSGSEPKQVVPTERRCRGLGHETIQLVQRSLGVPLNKAKFFLLKFLFDWVSAIAVSTKMFEIPCMAARKWTDLR